MIGPMPLVDGGDDDAIDDTIDEDKDEDDAIDDEDDDEDMLVDIPFIVSPAGGRGPSSWSSSSSMPLGGPGSHLPPRRQQPPENLVWDEHAIMDCFRVAAMTHDYQQEHDHHDDMVKDKQQQSQNPLHWNVPSLYLQKEKDNIRQEGEGDTAARIAILHRQKEALMSWQPRTLDLPVWAVDPIEQQALRLVMTAATAGTTATTNPLLPGSLGGQCG